MNLCMDCVHFHRRSFISTPKCGHAEALIKGENTDPVFGNGVQEPDRRMTCKSMRELHFFCGPKGRYFEQKFKDQPSS